MEYKGYIIKSFLASPNLKVIVTSGRGGKVPELFLGAHTSEKECMKLIDSYKHKVNKNVKKSNIKKDKLTIS